MWAGVENRYCPPVMLIVFQSEESLLLKMQNKSGDLVIAKSRIQQTYLASQ